MAIIIGALAAGLAWVIFTILPDVWRPARMPVVIVAGLVGALIGWSHFDKNRAGPRDVERELLESESVGELARAFRDTQPAEFAQYVQDVEAAMREGATSEAMSRATLRMQLAAEQRLATLSDADIASYYQIRRDELLELRDANPAICSAYFHGRPLIPADIQLSDATRRRQVQLYVRAFRSPQSTQHTPFAENEWPVVLDEIRQRLYAAVGEDVALLAADADVSGRERRSCEVYAELYNQLSTTPQTGRVFVTMNGARQL